MKSKKYEATAQKLKEAAKDYTKKDDYLGELLANRPDGSLEEIETWKRKVRMAREESEKAFEKYVRARQNQWVPGEWERMRKNLEELSLKQLCELTNRVGIIFSDGNKNITDTKNMTAKEQFIMVLDEVDKGELYREYEKIKGKS